MKNSEIANKIRQLRELKGFSQEVIAVELDITIRAYSKLERGETQMTVERLYAIGEIIGISVKEIMSFEASTIFNDNVVNHLAKKPVEQNIAKNDSVTALYEKLLKEKDEVISLLRKSLG